MICNRKKRATGLAPRQELRDSLKQRGLRLTRQRRMLLDLVQHSSRHLDAESLWKLAVRRDPAINLATVYRTLALLKRLGLVDELDLMHVAGGQHYYEAARLRHHVHLTCFRCGRTQELQSELFDRLRQQAETATGFRIEISRLEFGGLCAHCR